MPPNGIKSKLYTIYNDMKTTGKKMVSATKFIDYFIHDILDLSILNKNAKSFLKNITTFDIKGSLDEIIEVM